MLPRLLCRRVRLEIAAECMAVSERENRSEISCLPKGRGAGFKWKCRKGDIRSRNLSEKLLFEDEAGNRMRRITGAKPLSLHGSPSK